jgi:alkanesulfonate monooxygenase SsuD/methylene tetrahydromethanopterin reductase-like flavin-dependent oxidoreductase (luciferase family)
MAANSTVGGKKTTFPLVLGLDTFGDRTNTVSGQPLSHAQTIRNVVEEGVLAEQVGVDFFGIGEHHTDYFPMPAADVVLASIAARTQRIHLGSAVTVLSSDDPVRVFQRYSTLNAVSNGRAEVILGRGSSIESFPLFGYDLADCEQLFEEKTALFAQLLQGGPVTWQGTTTAALRDQDVVPHLDDGRLLPAWVGVGHSGRSPRLLPDAGDHRWATGALRAFRSALPTGASQVRPTASSCRRSRTRSHRAHRRTST